MSQARQGNRVEALQRGGRFVLLLLIGLITFGVPGCGIGHGVSYLLARPTLSHVTWIPVHTVPAASMKFPPQGLAIVQGRIVLTNHWNDLRSEIYLLNREGGVIDTRSMPAEATHTSGLSWDGVDLWAVDYNSAVLYRLDYEALLRGDDFVRNQYPTGLRGVSAVEVVKTNGGVFLALSDFRRSSRTYFIRMEDVSKLGTASVPELAWLSYRNGAFSQGLAWDGKFLYEAVNNSGTDRIEIRDVTLALHTRESRDVKGCGSFAAPDRGVEDLAFDGETLWTTDEHSYLLYRLETPLAAVSRTSRE